MMIQAKRILKGKVNTVSNWMSLSRMAIAPVVAFFVMRNRPEEKSVILMLILLIVLTDILDGTLARLLHQESELGKVLDPLADKFSVATILVPLAIVKQLYLDPLFVGLMVLVIVRDLMILFLGSRLIVLNSAIPRPSKLGKLAVATLSFTFFSLLLFERGEHDIITVFAVLSYFTVFISGVGYLRLYFLVRNQKEARVNANAVTWIHKERNGAKEAIAPAFLPAKKVNPIVGGAPLPEAPPSHAEERIK